jgi:hypothetical protein
VRTHAHTSKSGVPPWPFLESHDFIASFSSQIMS